MSRRAQAGLGAVAAVLVLVLLAVLAATLIRLSSGVQWGLGQALQGARTQAAVRAGLEWGLFQVLKGGWSASGGCASAQSQTLDLRGDSGSWVTVSCSRDVFNEGESAPGVAATVRVIRLQAVACTGSAGACPDAAAAGSAGYVERMRVLTLTN